MGIVGVRTNFAPGLEIGQENWKLNRESQTNFMSITYTLKIWKDEHANTRQHSEIEHGTATTVSSRLCVHWKWPLVKVPGQILCVFLSIFCCLLYPKLESIMSTWRLHFLYFLSSELTIIEHRFLDGRKVPLMPCTFHCNRPGNWCGSHVRLQARGWLLLCI